MTINSDSNDHNIALEMNRRTLLNIIWMATIGLLCAALSAIGISMSLPRARKNQFGGTIAVGPVTELPAAGDPPVNFPNGKFWLIHTSAGLLALYKACTHLDCMFDWNVQEGRFICPCHGSQFGRDGILLNGPAPRSLDRFVIEIVSAEGEVLAATNPATGKPLPLPAAVTAKSKNASVSQTSHAAGDASSSDAVLRVDTGRRISGALLPS